MKRMFIFWMLLIFSGCHQKQAPHTDGQLRIAVSIFPIQNILEKIAGDRASVFHLVPYDANPHTYEPPPSIVRDLAGVDLFVGVHPEFDGWVTRYLPPKTPILYFLSQNADSIDSGAEIHARHHQPENPHFWLSLRKVRSAIPMLIQQLDVQDSLSREIFHRNATDFIHNLDTLDAYIRSFFVDIPNRKFIQWHPAWNDFAEDYGLEIIGTIEHGHGDEPSVRSFGGLIEKARSENVRVVVVDLNVESRAAEALVREIDGVLLRLDVIGSPDVAERSNYFRLMKDNAKKLAAALSGQSD